MPADVKEQSGGDGVYGSRGRLIGLGMDAIAVQKTIIKMRAKMDGAPLEQVPAGGREGSRGFGWNGPGFSRASGLRGWRGWGRFWRRN